MNLLDIKKILETETGFSFTLTKSLDHGILATSEAFVFSKKNQISIPEATTQILEKTEIICKKIGPFFEVKIVGPYINVYLKPEALQTLLNTNDLVKIPFLKKRILLEYVSPNVAKQLHAGHVRNMNIGESIRRLLAYKFGNGLEGVYTDNHWGDWGVQFGTLIYAYKYFKSSGKTETYKLNDELKTISFTDYTKLPFEALLAFYIWASQNKDNIKDYAKVVRQEFLKLESKDPENLQLWTEFIEVSKKEITPDLELFNVRKFDIEQGESYYEPMLENLYNFFEKNQLWSSLDQDPASKARFIDFEKLALKLEKPALKNLGFAYLVSSDGYSTYLFRDVATRISWVNTFDSEKMITLTGNEQKHHFEQFFAICDYLSLLPQTLEICKKPENLSHKNLVHISYGMLALKNRPKMSTRNGVILTARDFYNEVNDYAKKTLTLREPNIDQLELEFKAKIISVAAIKWYDLQKDSLNDLSLDIAEIMSFDGNTGVYQLYTIARINSLLDKNQILNKIQAQANYTSFNTQENSLLFKILQYPIVLEQTIETLKPHLLTNYCFALANEYNSWYNTCSLINESDENRKQALLVTSSLIRDLLKFNLEFLAIDILEKM
jgi:arginyl-tRNA synthetase